MAKPSRSAIERELVDRHGRTYAEELRVNLARGTPSALVKLLVAAILFSARIGAKQGVRAAGALFEQGWTTAGKLAGSTWEERVRVLDRSGYARYDERTATMLGQASELLLERYGGDLRALGEARQLGLPGDAKALARGHDRQAFARLVAALVRSSLAKDHDQILQTAVAG